MLLTGKISPNIVGPSKFTKGNIYGERPGSNIDQAARDLYCFFKDLSLVKS
jgi:hypothetical protein